MTVVLALGPTFTPTVLALEIFATERLIFSMKNATERIRRAPVAGAKSRCPLGSEKTGQNFLKRKVRRDVAGTCETERLLARGRTAPRTLEIFFSW